MSKLFNCNLCNRTFTRKEHLIRHHNRKIKCINPENPILNYEDVMNEEQNKSLQHLFTSTPIIVKKIGEDDKLKELPKINPNLNQDIKVVNMELPNPINTELPKPEITELPNPINTELPKPEITEVPKPEITELPKSINTELPKSINTELPKHEITELPKSIKTELPKPEIMELPKSIKTELSKRKKQNKTMSRHKTIVEKKPLTLKEQEAVKLLTRIPYHILEVCDKKYNTTQELKIFTKLLNNSNRIEIGEEINEPLYDGVI